MPLIVGLAKWGIERWLPVKFQLILGTFDGRNLFQEGRKWGLESQIKLQDCVVVWVLSIDALADARDIAKGVIFL